MRSMTAAVRLVRTRLLRLVRLCGLLNGPSFRCLGRNRGIEAASDANERNHPARDFLTRQRANSKRETTRTPAI